MSQLQFERASKLSPFDARNLRVVFLAQPTLGKLVQESGLSEALGTRLVSEAEKAFGKALEGADPEFKALNLGTTEGGAFQVLLVEKDLDAYEILKGLRKSLGAQFKEGTRVLEFDLSRIGAKQQELVLAALASLAVIAPFQSTVFGKRAEKKAEKKTEKKAEREIHVRSSLAPAVFAKTVESGLRQGEATNFVRQLADLPGNELNPTAYKRKLQTYAKEEKVTLKYLGTPELKKLGAGSFLAVGQADPQTDAGIAHLSWKPKASRAKLILVGKGLCFDTGGYNVKVADYMYGMQKDMTGSALAWAIFHMVRELKLPLEAHALLAISENLISPTAFKANDVVTAMNGTTIEIVNTDAEGRMVLADTLAYAARLEGDLVLDFATLTGSVIRALDTRRSGVYSNRAKLGDLAVTVGRATGERVWNFELSSDYKEGLKSKVADTLQCSLGNAADHLYAATFLRHFVGEKTPWVHMDLAASGNKGGLGLADTDTTGYGVRWALEFIREALLS